MLLSIEQDSEGSHHLESAIIATPWEDDRRLHDASATELAVADAIPDTEVRGVADLDFDGEARVAAMDLSVVDGRRELPAGDDAGRGARRRAPLRRGPRHARAALRLQGLGDDLHRHWTLALDGAGDTPWRVVGA